MFANYKTINDFMDMFIEAISTGIYPVFKFVSQPSLNTRSISVSCSLARPYNGSNNFMVKRSRSTVTLWFTLSFSIVNQADQADQLIRVS